MSCRESRYFYLTVTLDYAQHRLERLRKCLMVSQIEYDKRINDSINWEITGVYRGYGINKEFSYALLSQRTSIAAQHQFVWFLQMGIHKISGLPEKLNIR